MKEKKTVKCLKEKAKEMAENSGEEYVKRISPKNAGKSPSGQNIHLQMAFRKCRLPCWVLKFLRGHH